MLKILESIDLSEEMALDNIYYLLKTSYSSNNLKLLSKIQHFSNSYDFLQHYINKDINQLFIDFRKLEENYLNICNNENYLNFSQNIEKYISIFSNLILLFNLIIKNMNIIKSILSKVKNNLIKYGSKNIVDFDFQNKINEFTNNLLKLSLDDNLYKINILKTFNKDNISTANKTESNTNSISKDKFINEEELNNDLYSSDNDDNTLTPNFPSKGENNSLLTLINNNNENLKPKIKLKEYMKKKSIDSILNLHCVNNTNDINKEKPNIKENGALIFLEDEKDNQKKKGQFILNNNIKNLNESVKKSNSDKINIKFKNSNMYSFILKKIRELHKKKYINSTQKIKIKQLIITKSSRVKNLYYSYLNNNVKKFIQEIKKYN